MAGPAIEAMLGRLVASNNQRVAERAHDAGAPNPRPTADLAWVTAVEEAFPPIRGEWERFAASGGALPRIEDLVAEDQGNDGPWRAGLLVSKGRAVPALADRFPVTIATALAIPGIWSALWSVLEPGTELPEHTGPNAGVLRFHLGVDCPIDTALRVEDVETPYVEGVGILFDDTAPHAAWNRGDRARVTLFCEVLRPAPLLADVSNRLVQRLVSADPRYRGAPARAVAWDAALNG